jgi:hypothetical protein
MSQCTCGVPVAICLEPPSTKPVYNLPSGTPKPILHSLLSQWEMKSIHQIQEVQMCYN